MEVLYQLSYPGGTDNFSGALLRLARWVCQPAAGRSESTESAIGPKARVGGGQRFDLKLSEAHIGDCGEPRERSPTMIGVALTRGKGLGVKAGRSKDHGAAAALLPLREPSLRAQEPDLGADIAMFGVVVPAVDERARIAVPALEATGRRPSLGLARTTGRQCHDTDHGCQQKCGDSDSR
jgi:hypothetical protein